MNYTNQDFRKQIYKDRTLLDEFGLDKRGTLNATIFDHIQQTGVCDWYDAEEHLLTCFNNAHYIMALICKEKFPRLHVKDFLEVARDGHDYRQEYYEAVTMGIVYNYLQACRHEEKVNYNLLQSISNKYRAISTEDMLSSFNGSYHGLYFSRVILDSETIKKYCLHLDAFYNPDTPSIREIVDNLNAQLQEDLSISQPEKKGAEAQLKSLTTQQQALFVKALAEFCEKSEECRFNKKQRKGLATITSKLFGCGEKKAYNEMGSHGKEDKEAVAAIFDEAWPKFAEFIRNSFGKKK